MKTNEVKKNPYVDNLYMDKSNKQLFHSSFDKFRQLLYGKHNSFLVEKDTIIQMQWISLTYEFFLDYNTDEDLRNHTKKLSLIDSSELSPL
jgi:hypothetical protein